ncbi:Mur ligase family protein [Halobacteriovorax sp. GB3]|uniref:UDP-N-acetylmuramate--L-alanine ligase n=1 Tax=Halobacteriovorax sp. GB3 TaxID=2719615 RepID=UPI002362F61B|nr:Mur ligase family protein [Halobacteriovorax sp. GB3]MDD0852636.1 Mur ligase family protein [Halobacteriovorax sp. GB3]
MNLDNKISWEELKSKSTSIKKIFFYRVCGTGMGAAACLLKEKGYEVEGGDNNFYPPMSTYLESTKIPLYQLDEITPDFLKQFDLIVVGNVVPGSSDQARMIESLDVPFCSFPQALGSLVLNDINVVGLAGTHGKTTTTYFATQVFEKLGEAPGYFIGGVVNGRASSKLGEGKYFFIESDEYDSAYFEKISKFRLYSLKNMILTSLEFDHADIFDSIEDIKNEFKQVVPNIKGSLIFNGDYSAINELIEESELDNVVLYGLDQKFGPKILDENDKGTRFEIIYKNETFEFSTNLIGKHNILNLTSVLLYALEEGFSYESLTQSILELEMVKRRQEVRGFYKGAPVIDDFAHHPRAVELTIDSIKTKYPNKEILVVMEPNSATARSSIFQNEFEQALEDSDYLVFTKPNRPTSVKGCGNLDYEKIVSSLNEKGRKAFVANDLNDLLTVFNEHVDENKVILVLSNGTCLGLWESEFVKEIS